MIDFINQFGLLLLIIVFISFLAKLARQPIILGYVVAGLVFSLMSIYTGFTLGEAILIFSEIGVTFLLFLMGLEFDFRSLRYLGWDIMISTILQSVIFFILGFGISMLFGFGAVESSFLGILFMFSSTLLAAKWVEDKKESKSLHGKIVLGTLILQDILAIIALTVVSMMDEGSYIDIALVPFKGVLLVGFALIMSRYVLGHLLKIASRYPELLFIFSLSICFLFVTVAPILGYSTTIGAFIGGIVLANTIYKADISSRLKSLVIFFNMLFFVGLGFQVDVFSGANIWLFSAIFALMTIILKPFIIYGTLRWRGYDMKTSFTSGLYLSQASEFGMIIIAAGTLDGLADASLKTVGIIVVISTMLISSYLIKYSDQLYKNQKRWLLWAEKFFSQAAKEDMPQESSFDFNIMIFGYQDISMELLDKMQALKKKIIVVENDPEKIEMLRRDKRHFLFNSVNNPEFFSHIPFEKIELVVSSLQDKEENKMIISELKKRNSKAIAIVTAKSLRDSIELYENNADYVIFTSYLNDQQVSMLLDDYTQDMNKLITRKINEQGKLLEMQKKRTAAKKDLNFSFYDLPKQYRSGIETVRTRIGGMMKKAKPVKKDQALPKPCLDIQSQQALVSGSISSSAPK